MVDRPEVLWSTDQRPFGRNHPKQAALNGRKKNRRGLSLRFLVVIRQHLSDLVRGSVIAQVVQDISEPPRSQCNSVIIYWLEPHKCPSKWRFFCIFLRKTYTAASISAARPLITERSCNRSCIERGGGGLSAEAFAKACKRLFSFCAERNFPVCNFYVSAFSEILLSATKS